jgi:hypothetical protein
LGFWYPEVHGWAVMLDGFRDSWHQYKTQAIEQRDELNLLLDQESH